MGTPKPICGNFFDLNILNNIPRGSSEELFEELVKDGNVLIERIISEGHTSSEWYDQEENEFCCVLRGAADLLFEGGSEPTRMNPGTWVFIPAHARHKVTWTAESEQTVWIAIKWKGSNSVKSGESSIAESTEQT